LGRIKNPSNALRKIDRGMGGVGCVPRPKRGKKNDRGTENDYYMLRRRREGSWTEDGMKPFVLEKGGWVRKKEKLINVPCGRSFPGKNQEN